MELGDSTGLSAGLLLGQLAREHMGRAQSCIPGFPQHQALHGACLTNFSPGVGDRIHGLVGSSPPTQGCHILVAQPRS